MHTVLIDASSAILLFKGGLFEAVAEAYRLTAAGPVGDELTGGGYPGERATLAAMAAGRGDFVIIDDGAGARFCRRHAIPYINALLCPRILKLAGRLSAPAAAAHMDRIRRQGRYAPAIVAFAYDCEDAILEPFLPDVSQALSRGFYSNGPGGQKGRMW